MENATQKQEWCFYIILKEVNKKLGLQAQDFAAPVWF